MFDLKTWDGFSELKKQDLDYLLDTTALNKKMAMRNKNPYRWKTGSFRVPKGANKEQKVKAAKLACEKFVQAMEQQGWELKSKLQVYGPYPAFDILYNIPLLDQEELRIRGIFKTEPKPVRIEVPPGIVRQSPDHKITLQEAMKATGIKPVPRK